METDRPPLDETVAYTLKIVWCPYIKIFSPSTIFVVAIWVLYIICCTQGIDTSKGILTINVQVLIDFGAIKSDLVQQGEVWRLITAAFLHIDLLHITMNTLSILFFVTRLEKVYNPLYISVMMVVSAIAGKFQVIKVTFYLLWEMQTM